MAESNRTGRFVEELGGKGEVLVLVHGLGGSTNTWYPQAQVLKRDLRDCQANRRHTELAAHYGVLFDSYRVPRPKGTPQWSDRSHTYAAASSLVHLWQRK